MNLKLKIVFFLLAFAFCFVALNGQNSAVRIADLPASALYQRARDFQAREDWYAAVELYQEALNKNPSYGEAWFALAECSYELEQYDLTVKYCDTALKYIKNRTDISNLKGFALIGLHKLNDARAIFTGILTAFPNDVEARFGLARLDLFDGKFSTAEQYFLDALKRESKNKKALISLALIADQQGKIEESRLYIREALRTHSGKPEVYYFAGYLAAKEGDLTEAESLIRTAVLLDGNYDKAYKLLADILFVQKRYAETVDICDFRIAKNNAAVSAGYLKGLALAALGENEKALAAWQTGLNRDSQDEIMRAAFELLVFDATAVEDPRREKWAAYHIDKAEAYMEKFTAVHALYEYQRALRIQPLNLKARLAFAGLLLNKGLTESYLSQLIFLKDEGKADKHIEDIIESYTSLLQNTLPLQWGVQPFYLDKTRWKTGLYTLEEDFSLYHQNVVSVSAGLLADIFNADQFVSVKKIEGAVSSYAQAFKDARTRGFDFFALLDAAEEERGISLNFDLYSAASGNKLLSLNVYRTGNDRLASALQKIRDDLTSALPHKAKIIARRGSVVLIDYGRKDGAAAGQVFDMYKTGDTGFDGSSLDLKYDEKKRIGTLTLTAVGEDISQGEFKQNGFYDLLALGDEAIPVVKAEESAAPAPKKEKKKKSKAEAAPVQVEKRKSVIYDLIKSIR